MNRQKIIPLVLSMLMVFNLLLPGYSLAVGNTTDYFASQKSFDYLTDGEAESVLENEETENIQTNLVALESHMIYVEEGSASEDSFIGLIDEQDSLTLNEKGEINFNPKNLWKRANGNKKVDASIYLDLKEEYKIEKLGFYDMSGISNVEFSIGVPGNWIKLPKSGDLYNKWNFIDIPEYKSTRYIKIDTPNDAGDIGEIVVIGEKNNTPGENINQDLQRIDLNTNNLINVVGISTDKDVDVLIDEQPEQNQFPDNAPTTYFALKEGAGWPAYNDLVDIDLKAKHKIEYVTFYVGEKKGDLKLYLGDGTNWELMRDYTVENESDWIRVKVDGLESRYIRIEKTPVLELYEVVVYGETQGAIDEGRPAKPFPTKPTIDVFMGMNGMFPTPIEVVKATGSFREYHNIYYNSDPNDGFKTYFPPYQGVNFDELYKEYNDNGMDVLVTLQRSTDNYGGVEKIPTSDKSKRDDPNSYLEHGRLMFNFAARYGSTAVEQSRLTLSKNEKNIKTGMGLINHFENWNEPNSTWMKEDEYFKAYEFAAMTSVDYDGHESTLGSNVGIKNADPNATFVMGGLAGINVDYIKAMDYWFKNNRSDGKFPADVINVHTYVGQHAPENTSYKDDLLEIVKYVSEEIPGKEVWLTEFGYDSYNGEHGRSKNSAPTLQAQADWLIRSYLVASSTGIQRAFMFQDTDPGVDNNEWAAGLFKTSGLTRHKEFNYERKISYYYTYSTRNILSGYKFDSVISEDDIYIYKFVNNTNGKEIYSLWLPTEEGKVVEDHKFEYAKKGDKVNKIDLVDESIIGEKTTLNSNGEILFNVTETPTFIEIYKDLEPVVEWTVTYNSDGGSEVASATVADGEKVAEPEAPKKAGYIFKGWYENQVYTTAYDFVKTVTKDITLYAKWEKEPVVEWTVTYNSDGGDSSGIHFKIDEKQINFYKAYLKGYPDNTIRAQGNITRAEVAAIFARLKMDSEGINHTAILKDNDVNNGEWYVKYIDFITKNKIMEGYEDGSFKPTDKITRAEFTATVFRYSGLTGKNSNFDDVKGHWAEKYIGSLTNEGWIIGYPDGTFKPEKDISREEAVIIVNKMLDRKVDGERVYNSPVTTFKDLDRNSWSYSDLVEATNSYGIYK